MRVSIKSLEVWAVLALGWAASQARAEVPMVSPEELQKNADVIVTGKVQAVHALEWRSPSDRDYLDIVFLVALSVEKVEKGEGIKAGDPLFVRSWMLKKRPKDWVGPSGHGTAPGPGAQVRVFLQGKKDGWYVPLLPNGIEALDSPPILYAANVEEGTSSIDTDPSDVLRFWWLFLAGLAVGLACGWLVTRMLHRVTPARPVEERKGTIPPA
jgi:hypothetical protein